MNNIILNYIIKGFIKNFLIVIAVIYCFSLILNLLEEVEFFKNLNVGIITPLILTSIYVPSLIIKILPFIIFISSLWFVLNIKNNKDLLTIKVFGYSNIKIFFILAICAFTIGWIVLFAVNPLTSKMSKYYVQLKANYSRDIDHLISFKRDGLWIKEKVNGKQRYISSKKLENNKLKDLRIFHLDEDSNFIGKIIAKEANIDSNEWILSDVKIFEIRQDVLNKVSLDSYKISSNYNLNKINKLFKNFDTVSFLELAFNSDEMALTGYSRNFLNQSLHTLLVLPFFLLLMTGIASILAMGSLKKKKQPSNNFYWTSACNNCLLFKDFSFALGQIERVPLVLSIWAPIIVLSLITLVGVIQINEK